MRSLIRQLAVAALLGLMAVVTGAFVTGNVAVVVTHGVSMQPTYHRGDLVVIVRARSYRQGDIAAYRLPHLVVLHRIIDGDANGFVFRGDNNESIDSTKPAVADILGRAVVHIPQGGVWLNRATSPLMLAVYAFSLLVGGGTAARSRRSVLKSRGRRKRKTMASNADRPRRAIPKPVTLSPPQRIAGGAIAAVGLLAAVLGALAWTGPVERLAPAKTPPAPSMTFAYSAQVPRTAAYDGTVVSSPDPVFRKLARVVDVRFSYQGEPGSVTTVTAELSTANGWHTSLPLAATSTSTQGRPDGVVRLDLDALQARASAAAAVIGVPAGAVTVAVTPRVITSSTAPEAKPFTPALKLSLTPLQLTLSGPETLIVQGVAPPKRTVLVPRTLGLPGRALTTVATARTVSVFLACLTLGALLAALAFLLSTQRSAPTGEAAGIRRRYTSLLVRVDPMPNPAGRPVVNVTEFKTLVRLAERYELLILHWSRNDAETFVVQDEGTTYRYHCGLDESPVDEDAEAVIAV
jgi:signal peptidase I